MNILQTPNAILNKKAEPVKKVDTKIRKIIKEMKDTLRASDIGVGLAAPQVGISLRMFVASEHMPDVPKKEHEPILVCINPKILSKSKIKPDRVSRNKGKKKKDHKLEGCLSMINIWGPVTRSDRVNVEYQDEQGKKHVKTFKGFMATIVQHETDHLDGILFTQRVLEQGGTLYREQSGKEVFEEIEV